MIEGVDYFIRKVAFPNRANPALVVVNDDGTFDVYLNTLYSDEQQRAALAHELRHIKNEHFYIDLPAAAIERQADGEDAAAALCPAGGKIAHFYSEASLAHYLKTLANQRHVDLTRYDARGELERYRGEQTPAKKKKRSQRV